MKKIAVVALALVMLFALSLTASARVNLDVLYVDVNTLSFTADGQVDPGLKSEDTIEIDPGQKLYILGWAFSDDFSNLKEIVTVIDGTEHKCADNYRDRPGLGSVLGVDASVDTHAGIGKDDGAFELGGISELADGTYEVDILAYFDDGSDEIAKTFTLVVGTGVSAPASEGGLRDFDSAKGDKLSYDQILVNGAEIANGNDAVIANKKLVDGSDGSVSTIALHGWFGNANAKIASYGYTIDGGEPVYGDFAVAAEQDVINAGGESRYTVTVDVSGLQDGAEHTIWVVVKLDNGDIVKLNRYDNRGQEGGKDREVYVNYKAPLTETPPETQPTTGGEEVPKTGDATVAMFAVLAVLAMGAAVVFAKKRSF
ncbi:MAG: LPXTG cell wall anchor domain-containing protein [Clostridia bacterium]|nr:LPXTG cell wall anchor domain-containing protein [Clostridia bacterium]